MILNDKLSDEKKIEITGFLLKRFKDLEDLRTPIDDDLKYDIDIYNNIDFNIDAKEDHEEKYRVPYVYTIVQTMTARLIEAIFGRENYVKLFMEKDKYESIEQDVEKWAQEELDKIRFKSRARDFLEDALVQRTCWLQLRPIVEGGKLKKVEFDPLKFTDVWFDTKARTTFDTDFFVRKFVKYFKIKENEKNYFDVELIENTTPPDEIKIKQEYEAKNGVTYYDPEKTNVTDEVELMEYYGVYDLSDNPDEPDFKDVIFTLANRTVLVRAETNDLETERKVLLFPIRPLRQANSLIGKGVPQLVRDLQYELNEIRSLRAQNTKLQAGLLFKYKKAAGIDFDELLAAGGNAIGFEDNPQDIDIFPVPNLTQVLSFVGSDIIQDMQQITGAVDYVMGTSAGRGTTETASGIKTITEQAMFKFTMMAQNCYDDLIEFINFLLLLWIRYGREDVILRYPSIGIFLDQTEKEIEETQVFDISLSDLAMRRDVERAQWINAVNVLFPLVQQMGGNVKELLRKFLEKLQFDNIDVIINPPASAQGPGGAPNPADLLAMLTGGGSSGGAPSGPPSPGQISKATPEEMALQENPQRV